MVYKKTSLTVKSNKLGFWTFWTSKLTNFKTPTAPLATDLTAALVPDFLTINDVFHEDYGGDITLEGSEIIVVEVAPSGEDRHG